MSIVFGACSSIGRAPLCGSGGNGIVTRQAPHRLQTGAKASFSFSDVVLQSRIMMYRGATKLLKWVVCRQYEKAVQ